MQAPLPRVMPREQPEGQPGYADQLQRHRKVDIVEIGGILDIARSRMYQVAEYERDNKGYGFHPSGCKGTHQYSEQDSDP